MTGNGKDMSSMTMMDLFRQEAENHSTLLSENLMALEKNGNDQDTLGLLMRSAHSLKGAARIMDLDDIVGLASSMEKVFNAAQKGEIDIDSVAVGQLLKGVGKLGELASIADEELDDWFANQKMEIDQLEKTEA